MLSIYSQKVYKIKFHRKDILIFSSDGPMDPGPPTHTNKKLSKCLLMDAKSLEKMFLLSLLNKNQNILSDLYSYPGLSLGW